MPEQGPMIGYAATVVIEPSKKAHKANKPTAKSDYRRCMQQINSCIQYMMYTIDAFNAYVQ